MTALSTALTTALLHSLWQCAAVAVLLRVWLAALSGRAAQTRYLACCAGLAAMTALPIATAIAAFDATPSHEVSAAAVEAVLSDVATQVTASVATPPRPPEGPRAWLDQVQPWILPAWIIGVLAFSIRLAAAGLQVRVLRRTSPPADAELQTLAARIADRIGLRASVSVLAGNVAGGFRTFGWVRPIVLVPPAAALGLSPWELEALLAHELAHIRRHDYLVNICQMAVETLLFFHPAIWWASARIRTERELCCDDIVVADGDRATYARALTSVARLQMRPELPLHAARGSLVRRVQHILFEQPQKAHGAWAVPAIVVAIAVTAVGLAQAQERIAERTTLRGRVTEVGTGQPMPGVTVRAFHVTGIPVPNRPTGPIENDDRISDRNGRPHPVYYAVTDDTGRYEIRGLRGGEYLVAGGGQGFVTSHFGQTAPNMPEATVVVAAGVTADRVDLLVARAGRVSGRILSEDGTGITGVEITLLRRQYFPGGVRPTGVVFAQSEDGGAFDLWPVPPGEYYIHAAAADGLRPPGNDKRAVYETRYFPTSLDIGGAQLISVGGGQALSGLDMVLTVARTASITGRLIDPAGTSTAAASVYLMPPPADGITRLSAAVGGDGRFRIADVPPGTYVAMVSDRANGRRWSPHEVTVTGDVSGLELIATTGIRARGRILTDDRRRLPFDANELTLTLYPQNDVAGIRTSIGAGMIASDGSFTMEGAAGVMSLHVGRVPRGWFLKSTTLDDVDVTDAMFELAPGGGVHTIDVVLTNKGGRLSGGVADRMGRSVANALVVIFPADRARWSTSRLMQTTFSHQMGRFDFGAIPAADYRTVAVPALPREAWTDPAVLDRLWSDSVAVTITEGQAHSLQLKVVATPTDLIQ